MSSPSTPTRICRARIGAALPVLVPHPDLTAPRTGYPLAKDVVRYSGEPIAMVVATDRYVAEDAAERILVSYEPLPPVVGLENAAAAERLVYPDVPGNLAAHMVQESGDARQAIDAAPHRLQFRLDIERSASTPLEGRGVYARWDAMDGSMRVCSSTQLPVSLRNAIASRLDLPLKKVEVIAPDIGGGFGTKLNHPWPEEVLLPWAARLIGKPLKWVDDRREMFIASSSERAQIHFVDVGFDDQGHVLGLSVRFLHETGAYTPYGIIVPIITMSQLPGPYRIPNYRVEFDCLYTNTVIVTPYRGAGRPQAAFAMERTMDRIAEFLGADRAEVRAANFVQPAEMPYDTGLIFQDGRPAIYDSGDFPSSLKLVTETIGWRDFPAGRRRRRRKAGGSGSASPATWRGPEWALRGRPRRDRAQRPDSRFDRTVLPGAGAPDDARADRRGRTRGADRRHRGDHRRHAPLRLRGRHVRVPHRRDERQRRGARRPQGAGQGAPHRRRGA